MDARDYIKDSPETHDFLAKLSRKTFEKFTENNRLLTAVLNDSYQFTKSKTEIWFTDKQSTIEWLRLQ